MKRESILLLLFLSIKVFSQGDEFYGKFENYIEQSEIIGNPTVQAPDVAAFQKVNFLPVNNYTGRVDISIPIYTIKSGNINIPISLSYNSSGVKVNDRGSSVGMNWSLNAGGMISKIVKGMEDFTGYEEVYEVDVLDWVVSPVGWLFPGYIGFPEDGYGATTYTGSYGEINDHLPDLFIVSAPGLNTQYVHSRSVPFELTGQGNKIVETFGEPTVGSFDVFERIPNTNDYEHYDGPYDPSSTLKCFEKIEITNTSGLKYTFNDLDVSQYSHYTKFINYNGWAEEDWKSDRKVESYRLSSVTDLKTNRNIQFEYQTYELSSYDPTDNGTDIVGDFYTKTLETKSFSTKYPQLNRLTKITFDGGSVEFIYGLDRQDITGEKALTKIVIKDYNGNIIKNFNLEYSYFQTPYATYLPQSKRLKLDKVYESNVDNRSLPGYTLTYNSTSLPLRGSWGQDFLGYNNDTYTSVLVDPQPIIYFYPNKGIYSSLPFNNGSGYDLLQGNYSLASNLEATKAGILEKIQYPTGGYSEFEYELNKFMINGNEVSGGGLRIKSQKIVDENQNEQILDYEYLTTTGENSGSIVSLPKYTELKVIEDKPYYPLTIPVGQTLDYLGFRVYRVSRAQAELTNNSFVGYSRVKVKNRVDNGYTIYNYSSPSEYPTELSTQTAFNGDSYYYPNGVGEKMAELAIKNGRYDITIDRDVYRGKLKESTVYDKNDNLLITTENQYTHTKLDEFGIFYDIQLGFEYGGHGEYIGNGITETAMIPSERYLLTYSKKTQYYPNGDLTETVYNEYDDNLPFLVKNTFTDSNGDNYETIFTYANNPSVSTQPYISSLINQNRLSELVKKEVIYDDINPVLKEEFTFKHFGYGIYDKSVLESAKGNSDLKTISTIDVRNSSGKILQYHREDGINVALVWGYNGEKLLAKVENMTSSFLYFYFDSVGGPPEDTNESTEQQLRDYFQTMRSNFPTTQITSYTYDPLIGVTSITDSSGNSNFYDYDEFNRLEFIRNNDGEVLEQYKYNFALDELKVKGIESLTSIRAGDNIIFTAKAEGRSGDYSYKWIISNGSINDIYNTSTNVLSISTSSNHAPNFTVTCEVTDNNTSETDSLSKQINVSSAYPALSVGNIIVSDYTVAVGDNLNYSINVSGGSGNYIYKWTKSNSQYSTVISNGSASSINDTISSNDCDEFEIHCEVTDTITGEKITRMDLMLIMFGCSGGLPK